MAINNINSNAITETASYALTSAANMQISVDFKGVLSQLYLKPYKLMDEYINSESTEIHVDGFNAVDKNSPAASTILAYGLNDIQVKMDTVMSYLNFIFKTVPQTLERSQ